MVEAALNRTPVSVITGFLGSGKTTLINYLVSLENLRDTALIINEFGEIGLDHILVESSFENTLLLENGCICCSIRGDLVDTISDLFTNVSNGKIPAFSRIIIETTGLADPRPIVISIDENPALRDRVRLDSVISTVDGVLGKNQMEKYQEASIQIASSDVLLLTKGDISDNTTLENLIGAANDINPTAPIREIVDGCIDPDELFNIDINPNRQTQANVVRNGEKVGSAHTHIESVSITHDGTIPEEKLNYWLSMLYSLRPQNLVRMKGVIWLEGKQEPLLLQAVGNSISPLKSLPNWPEPFIRTSIVIIYQGLNKDGLIDSFRRHVL